MILNALDYPDLAAAIAAASDGDRIYVPGVKRWRAPVGGFQITKSLQIYGDGPGDPGTRLGTVVEPAALGSDVFVLTPASGSNYLGPVYIHDLMIANRETVTPDGRNAIQIPLLASLAFESLRLERVAVINMSFEGLYLSLVKRLSMKKVTVGACHSYGIEIDSVGLAHLVSCSVGNNFDRGLECYYSPSIVLTSNVENNPQSGMAFYECPIAVANACRFEDAAPPDQFVKCDFIDCRGAATVIGSFFTTGFRTIDNPYVTTGIRTNSGCAAVSIFPNLMERPYPTVVYFEDDNRGCSVWPQREQISGLDHKLGTIRLPQSAAGPSNGGLLADPTISRAAQPTSDPDGVAGLVVPSRIALPTQDLPTGILLYRPPQDAQDSKWSLRVVIAGQWHNVEFLP